MRLGFTIQEAYVILLVGLSLLAAGATFYGQWALKKVSSLQQRYRLQIVNSRVRMAWWLIVVFTIGFAVGIPTLLFFFAIISFFFFILPLPFYLCKQFIVSNYLMYNLLHF